MELHNNVLGILQVPMNSCLYLYLILISGLKSLLQSHCLLLSRSPYNSYMDFHSEVTHLIFTSITTLLLSYIFSSAPSPVYQTMFCQWHNLKLWIYLIKSKPFLLMVRLLPLFPKFIYLKQYSVKLLPFLDLPSCIWNTLYVANQDSSTHFDLMASDKVP